MFPGNPPDPTMSFYFHSQDVIKRKNVLDAIVRLGKKNTNGPAMVFDLLLWVTDMLSEDEELDIPEAYRADVVQVYFQINPLEGEWDMSEADTPYAGATVTVFHM
jgi:hypothetical protein